jgi:hypothetical protein
VNQGPFVIVSVIVQPRHGIRYAMRKTAVIGKSVQEGARRQASEARCFNVGSKAFQAKY